MAMTTRAWLLDAAMVSSTPAAAWLTQPHAINLYADLPSAAAAVAPWLVPATSDELATTLPLPVRFGVSLLMTELDLAALADHLRGLRYLRTTDGQVFYLRFADMRVLQACERAWPASRLARVKGLVQSWTYVNRSGAWQSFAPAVRGVAQPLGPVSLQAFEALIEAGAADRMALALDKLREPDLMPTQHADQFSRVEQALSFMKSRAAEGNGSATWEIQRAVARQCVLSDGRVLQDADFVALLAHEPHVEQIDAWPHAQQPASDPALRS
ncbi:MAG: DUF4123 domain-containing protein [Burkholderiales bacterium]|nr:DUF4123 domain-containing protein [Burkholderiales bacterium]